MSLPAKPMVGDLDGRGRSTVRGLPPPEDPDCAVSKQYLLDHLADLPGPNEDPGDLTLIFDNQLI